MLKMLKLPLLLTKRTLVAQKIRKYDQIADQKTNPKKSGLNGGVYTSTIDELLQAPGITKRLQKSKLRRLPSSGKRALLSWEIPAFVWEGVLGSKKLVSMVKDYLGPDARLDDLYIKTVMDGHQSVSEGWHDDNVGYRLKLFMVFDTEGFPSGTIFIPRERPHLYNVKYIEEVRRLAQKPSMDHRGDEMTVSYKPGDCLLFDTNVPHRGDYSSGQGTRYCLMAEFIDRKKADAIIGKAPCGPGQGKQKIIIPISEKIDIPHHPLIDGNLLSKTGDGYAYGYDR